ncbi:MAG TPA: GNVR domain-containing protein [Bryobacteraceae bacterium]|nr:GNVR domain-containing protein [Bryobacteraceae bacterium]
MGAAQNYVSVSRRPPDVEDYIDMARRYRSWIVGPMFLGLVVSVVAGFLQPDTYISYAVMRISPPRVPEKLIPSVLNNAQLAERVDQLKTEILSRNNLVDIIQKPSLDLYKSQRAKLPMEDVVQTMKNRDIQITPLRAGSDGRLASAFQISFRYTDKYKASSVVRELVSRFESLNITVLQQGSQMTNTFLTDEKEKAKDRMDKLSAAITKFEMDNQGRLPQQAQANTTALLQVQMQIMNINSTINRDLQEKAQLQTQLDNLRAQQNYLESNLEQVIPGTSGTASVKNEKLVNLSKQISEQRSVLARAKKTYGDNYPEIAGMQAQITELEKEQAELEKEESATPTTSTGTPARTVVNPLIERQLLDYKGTQKSIQTSMASKTLEVEELNRSKLELEKQAASYQRRIDEAPLNEQQYAQLKSDFQLAKTNYEDFEKKQQQSETSQNLEEHKAGENLEVLDPANVPDKAVDPDRLIWAGMGVFGGLAFGVVLAAAKEVKNTSLKNLKDVRAYTNLPVLSSIPLLENALLVRRKRRLVWLAWSSAVVVGITLMAGSVYYYMVSTT